MNKKKLIALYLSLDLLAALATWLLFFVYRKYNVDHALFSHFAESVFCDPKFLAGLFIYPAYWVLIYSFAGIYNQVFRKSRLKELTTAFATTFLGTLFFFFPFILDDIVNSHTDYIVYYLLLFGLQFFLTYLPRVAVTTRVVRKIRRREIGFNTVMIGHDEVALNLYHLLLRQEATAGNFILGYVALPGEAGEEPPLAAELPNLGSLDDLESIVDRYAVEELIIALPYGEMRHVESIIAAAHGRDIVLKWIPRQEDFLLENIRTTSVIHEPLISIRPGYLPDWQRHLKRGLDIFASASAMLLLFPLYLFLALGVKASSPGPVFYRQERIGLRGRPFRIIKFRSMYVGSEKDTPLLSSKSDQRITPFGRFMRRSRLDETPQFFNVLVGEMSLVGPRPERQFFIDQIVKKVPYYKVLQGVKPGITSWGQVKYGYAENVDQMVERLKWDLLYMDNISLQMDFKILIYTILIVLRRTGK